MLDKNKIFARKVNIKKIKLEAFDDDVYIKEFIVSERNKLRELENADYQLVSIILSVCDEKGTPLFSTDDLEELGQMPTNVIDELFMAVISTNEPEDKNQSAKN